MSALASASRRGFLRLSLTASGALLLARIDPLRAADGPAGASEIGLFIRIEADNRVVIGARGCEIGQGVKTSLPMLIAEELDVAWSQVSVEQLPFVYEIGPQGPRSRYGAQGAGGSTSIPDGWLELRRIGAAARSVLVQAAATRWGVEPGSLRTEDGHVLHADGRRLAYADLAAEAAALELPAEPPLKTPDRYRIIGKPVRVADAEAIVRGAPLYGLDQRLEGAKVAMIERCPHPDGEIAALDDSAAKALPGVHGVYRIDGPKAGEPYAANLRNGVAVVADDTWTALKARRALKIEWTPGPWVGHDTAALRTAATAALDGTEAEIVQREGDVDAAFAKAARVVRADYEQPMLAHATLEPQNALLQLFEDRALLIAPLQSPSGASRVIHALTGIARENIEVRMTRSGGGFGRRLANDFVAEAVKVAQQAKVPVRLVWTREDDMANDWHRPFGLHRLEAALDDSGAILGWRHRVAGTSKIERDPGMAGAPSWIACHEGDEFPARLVPTWSHEFAAVSTGVSRGWWRAPLPAFIAFPVQGFVDEVAHALGQDPLALRLAMLGEPAELSYRGHGGPVFDTGRLRAVLELAAEKIGWGRSVPKGHGLGIAAHFVFGGYTAHAVEVAVDDKGGLRVLRCVCASDVGRPVNPLGLEAQLMGGTLDGLSTALNLQITLKDGGVVQRNFPDYPLLRSADAPDVEVHIVPSRAEPGGAGEMGIATIAPALTNAIFAATGKRIRRLPIGDQLLAS